TWVHHEIIELVELGCDVQVFASWDKPEIKTPEEIRLSSLTRYQSAISVLQIPIGLIALARPRLVLPMIKALFSDPPTPRQGLQWLRDIIRLARLLGEIRKFQPQSTICHFAGTRSNLGLMLQWLDQTPCIIKSHALDVFSGAALFSTKVNEAKRFYTISRYNVNFIATHYPKADASRIRVHTCGVPLDLLSFKPESDSDDKKPPVLLSVGRLIPMKGFDVLLAASKRLLDEGVDHRVIVIGEGPEENTLRAQADELGIRHLVELRGYGTPAEVRAALYAASILVMPSIWDEAKGTQDGIPVALMESMACGTLSVASRLSGIPELIENGQSGFLAEPGNSRKLADAIHSALSRSKAEKREILSCARGVIESQHDIQKLTRELLTDMETLV
ncbi:MAG: glycosyltransferase family 4 protein, partial [Myxococcota bacterium]|nr:glycosyltransferase family 4 protein [Myxococcota bacterium]